MARNRPSRYWASGRTLHLIDIENLAGGSRATAAEVAEAVAATAGRSSSGRPITW